MPVETQSLAATLSAEDFAVVASNLNARQFVLLGQAERLLNENETIATALDFFVVGTAHLQAGQTTQALAWYDLAADDTNADPTVRGAALRGLGAAHFQLGNVEVGRQRFQEAVDLPTVQPDATPVFTESSGISTYLSWVEAELSFGDCAGAVESMQALADQAASATAPALYGSSNGLRILGLGAALSSACPGASLQANQLFQLATVGNETAQTTPSG